MQFIRMKLRISTFFIKLKILFENLKKIQFLGDKNLIFQIQDLLYLSQNDQTRSDLDHNFFEKNEPNLI